MIEKGIKSHTSTAWRRPENRKNGGPKIVKNDTEKFSKYEPIE